MTKEVNETYLISDGGTVQLTREAPRLDDLANELAAINPIRPSMETLAHNLRCHLNADAQ